MADINKYAARSGRAIKEDGSIINLADQLSGNIVEEQKTQSAAVGGKVTFSQPIKHLEIYNTDATNAGVFSVNGINLTVPAGEVFKAAIGGTPSTEVTITGSTSYILTRYE